MTNMSDQEFYVNPQPDMHTIRAAYHKSLTAMHYPAKPPFDPPEVFPEFGHLESETPRLDKTNHVYPLVRELLIKLGLDRKNLGTENWNPFRDLVQTGQNILIKPNLVTHYHQHGGSAIFWTISHPSVIRALVDYASLAIGPSGRITIGDTPIENCDFAALCNLTGLAEMVRMLEARRHLNLELLDFRTYQTTQYPDGSIEKFDLTGDPRGYTDIDLGKTSLFQSLEDLCGPQNYFTLGDHSVDHLDTKTRSVGLPNKYHHSGRHVYCIPNTVLGSDCLISVAKLKTHKFSGITLCLKNAIGIAQGKEYLPHRRPGIPSGHGDSFPSYPSPRYLMKLRAKRTLFSIVGGKNTMAIRSLVRRVVPAKLPHEVYSEPLYGDWHGNDTIWRTTLDLNLILFHADKTGLDLGRPKRTYLGIIDGIVGMDHEAPMAGLPVDSRLLIAARDPVAADTLGAYLMGFDPRKIPTIAGASQTKCRALGDVTLNLNDISGNISLQDSQCRFIPTKGWKAHLTPWTKEYPYKDNIPNTGSPGS
ncbi:MAG: DUF362 domain-containing protein [Syntrophorhabdaceae bacterium]